MVMNSQDFGALNYEALISKDKYKPTVQQIILGVIIIAFIVMGIALAIIANVFDGAPWVDTLMAFMIPVLTWMLVVIVLAAVVSVLLNFMIGGGEKVVDIWKVFAEDNGMIYRGDIKGFGDHDATFFMRGHEQRMKRMIDINDKVQTGEFSWYNETKNGMRYAGGCTYVRYEVSRKVPHMLVDSKNQINVKSFGFKGERLHLEGGFGNNFSIIIPKGYQVDARRIFTPDVMDKMKTIGPKYDMELIGRYLYIFAPTTRQGEDYRDLLVNTQKIARKIELQVSGYNDSKAEEIGTGEMHWSGERMKAWGLRAIFGPFGNTKLALTISAAIGLLVVILFTLFR